MTPRLVLASACACALALACGPSGAGRGDGGPTFPGAALASGTSDSGSLKWELRTAPNQPPQRGVFEAELRLTDPSGAPVDGLTLDVTPWMPSMGHGSSVKPTVSGQGQGRYLVDQLSCPMAGHWELQTAVTGAVTDTMNPGIDVQ